MVSKDYYKLPPISFWKEVGVLLIYSAVVAAIALGILELAGGGWCGS